jgi:hypothetical protein
MFKSKERPDRRRIYLMLLRLIGSNPKNCFLL